MANAFYLFAVAVTSRDDIDCVQDAFSANILKHVWFVSVQSVMIDDQSSVMI